MKKNLILYFGSMSLSLLGNGVAAVLFPLIVLSRTGDIFAAGLLASVSAGTGVVAGLFGGVVADKVNRRNLSILADLLSGLSIALLAAIDMNSGLTLPVLIALSVLGAFADVPGMTARETLLPQLAPNKRGGLDQLVAARETLTAAVILVGPAIGGLVIGIIGVDVRVFFLTGGMSFLAALLTLGLNRQVGVVEPTETSPINKSPLHDLGEGIAFLVKNPITRGATILSAVTAAAMTVVQSTVMPAYFIAEGVPQYTGYVFSAIALGTMVGGGMYVASGARVSRRVWLVFGILGTGLVMVLLGALISLWIVLLLALVLGIVSGPASAVLGTATIDASESQVLGRVLGTQNAIVLAGPMLLGAPMGALAAAAGIRTVGLVLGILVAAAALWAVLGSSFRNIDEVAAREVEVDGLEHEAAC